MQFKGCLQCFTKSDVILKRCLRPLVFIMYSLVLLVLIPLLVLQAITDGTKKSSSAYTIAGVFVLMAVPISVWEIVMHTLHYTKPKLQKYIIRILWMVPIYAMNAYLGLVYPDVSIYLDSLRECYEAYVIYNFMKYLKNYLSTDMNLELVLEQKPQVNHIFPLCWMSPWLMGRELIENCKQGIMQYVVVRPITSALAFVFDMLDVYKEGELRMDAGFPYIVAANNVSQFLAMYCLVLFYRATKEQLSPIRPIGKFLCIKAVVFFSFFQSVLIIILVSNGLIPEMFDIDQMKKDDIKSIASRLQNFLICIEMFLAAVAHHYSFSHLPFVDPHHKDISYLSAVSAMWDVSDVGQDIREHFVFYGTSLSRRMGRGSSRSDEKSPLVNTASDSVGSLESGYQSIPDSTEVIL
ncbi:hypothetical protein M8J76_016556 [Diaphorina citri]|nr:hypothetical protein M8J76_016556 [Diaphorina citri]KAI5738664.1 hypothetical protein M8J77_009699 [Diaphorina citri]